MRNHAITMLIKLLGLFPKNRIHFLFIQCHFFRSNYKVNTDDGGVIEFNFCGTLNSRDQCPGSSGKSTLLTKDFECKNLAGSDHDIGHAIRRKESDDEDDNEKGGLTILYSGGDKCTEE